MTTETNRENEFPKEVLNEIAKELFSSAIETLYENEALKSSLIRRFFKNPQSKGIDFKSGRLEFESNGTDITLNLERDVSSDRLTLSTTSEGIEEHISIWLTYKEKIGESCTLFGGIERGEMYKVVLAFRKTDWYGDKPTEMQINNSEAAEKIRQFLHKI